MNRRFANTTDYATQFSRHIYNTALPFYVPQNQLCPYSNNMLHHRTLLGGGSKTSSRTFNSRRLETPAGIPDAATNTTTIRPLHIPPPIVLPSPFQDFPVDVDTTNTLLSYTSSTATTEVPSHSGITFDVFASFRPGCLLDSAAIAYEGHITHLTNRLRRQPTIVWCAPPEFYLILSNTRPLYYLPQLFNYTSPRALSTAAFPHSATTIFHFEQLLIPVWHDTHWTLVIVDHAHRQITYLDSLYSPDDASYHGNDAVSRVTTWLHFEHARHADSSAMPSYTTFIGKSPLQRAAIDCGIFCMVNIRCAALRDYPRVQWYMASSLRTVFAKEFLTKTTSPSYFRHSALTNSTPSAAFPTLAPLRPRMLVHQFTQPSDFTCVTDTHHIVTTLQPVYDVGSTDDTSPEQDALTNLPPSSSATSSSPLHSTTHHNTTHVPLTKLAPAPANKRGRKSSRPRPPTHFFTSRDNLKSTLDYLSTAKSNAPYPPLDLHSRQREFLQESTAIRQSPNNIGRELVAKTDIPAHKALGYYSGRVSDVAHGYYTMEIAGKLVDGTPLSDSFDDYQLSYINDAIWDTSMNNCICLAPCGLIRTLRLIKKGEPLYMHYGWTFDDWNPVYRSLLRDLICAAASTWTQEIQNITETTWWQELLEGYHRSAIIPWSALIEESKGRLRRALLLITPRPNSMPLPEPKDEYTQWWNTFIHCPLLPWLVRFRKAHDPRIVAPITTSTLRYFFLHNIHPATGRPFRTTPDLIQLNLWITHHPASTSDPTILERCALAACDRVDRGMDIDAATSVVNCSHSSHHNKNPTSPTDLGGQQQHPETSTSTNSTLVNACMLSHDIASQCPIDPQTYNNPRAHSATSTGSPVLQQQTPTRATIVWLNCGGLTEEKLDSILTEFRLQPVEVINLTDTRIHPSQIKWYRLQIKRALGDGISTIFSAVTSSTASHAHSGGQLVIVRHRQLSIFACHRDASGLGIITTIGFRHRETDYFSSSVYMPAKPPVLDVKVDSLWDRLQQFLTSQGLDITPHQYVERELSIAAGKAAKRSSHHCIGGDFNGGFGTTEGTYHGLAQWAEDFQYTKACDESHPNPATFFRGEWVSALDHVLISQSASTFANPDVLHWVPISDHAPVTIDIIHVTATPQSRNTHLVYSPITTSLRTERTRKRYEKFIKRLPDPTPHFLQARQNGSHSVGCLLEKLSVNSASCARIANSTATFPGKNCWSPEYVAHTSALRAWGSIRRGITAADAHRLNASPHLLQRAIDNALDRWTQAVHSLTNDECERNSLLNITGTSPSSAATLSRSVLLAYAHHMEPFILHRIHGRYRKEMRLRFLRLAQRRNNDATRNLSRLLTSMLGDRASPRKRRNPFSMQELALSNDSLTSDPIAIHSIVTDYFEDWFKTDPRGLATRLPMTTDRHVYNDRRLFSDRLNDAGVPVNIQDVLWIAITSTQDAVYEGSLSNASLRNRLTELLSDCPSFDEFTHAINNAKRGSSAGMTGLSYDQLRHMPLKWRRVFYDGMAHLWSHKHIPDYFRMKWLVPIPKTTDPKLQDLRPLALVETLRKAWISIFIRRITRFWTTNNILHPSQHGFLHGRGTDTAVLQLNAKIEAAAARKLPLFASSFDVKRAFDRPEKDLLIAAFTRLGVPLEVASYIVDLDRDGATVIRTPLAMAQHLQYGREAFQLSHPMQPNLSDGTYFVAQRGAGQGDVASPINWNAVFDPLLHAIQRVSPESDIDTVFADDLLCTANDISTLQQKADVIAAYAILIGLQLTPEKFRAFMTPTRKPSTHSITLHGPHWTDTTDIAMTSKQPTKYLGHLIDLRQPGVAQYKHTAQSLKLDLAAILRRLAPASLKTVATELCILARHAYAATLAPLQTRHLQALDRLFSAFYRKISNNRPTFPTAILYLPARHCGLGFKCFSDEVLIRKYGVLLRSLNGDAAMQSAAHILLHAGSAISNPWIAPLKDMGRSLGWELQHGVSPLPDDGEEDLLTALRNQNGPGHDSASVKVYNTLIKHGITTARDLYDDNGHPSTWILSTWPSLRDMPHRLPSHRSIPLRRGQIWYIQPVAWDAYAPTLVYEIARIDWKQGSFTMQQWERNGTSRWLRPKERLTRAACLDYSPLSINAWLQTSGNWFQVFSTPTKHQRHTTDANKRVIKATTRRAAAPHLPNVLTLDSLFTALRLDPLATYDIYTDGSWLPAQRNHLQSWPQENCRPASATAALIIKQTNTDWSNGRVHAIRLCNGANIAPTSVFPLELLALTYAIGISSRCTVRSIISDSKSAIDAILSPSSVHSTHRRDYHALLAAARSLYRHNTAKPRLIHVHAHVERRQKNKTAWSTEELGNHYADSMANGQLPSLPNFVKHAFPASTICTALIAETGWHWRNAVTGHAELLSLRAAICRNRLKNYCIRRSLLSDNSQTASLLWTPATLTSLARLHCLPSLHISERSFHIRILLDWDFNGRKRCQATSASGETGYCKTCCHNVLDDASHWITHCTHPDLALIRSETLQTARNLPALSRVNKRLVPFVSALLHAVANHPLRHLLWKGHLTKTLIAEIAPQKNLKATVLADANVIYKSIITALWGGVLRLRRAKYQIENRNTATMSSSYSSQTAETQDGTKRYAQRAARLTLRRHSLSWNSTPPKLPPAQSSQRTLDSWLIRHPPEPSKRHTTDAREGIG